MQELTADEERGGKKIKDKEAGEEKKIVIYEEQVLPQWCTQPFQPLGEMWSYYNGK